MWVGEVRATTLTPGLPQAEWEELVTRLQSCNFSAPGVGRENLHLYRVPRWC